MLHFSARKNYEKILYVNYTHTGLDCIYFIRLVNMVMVVYLHSLLVYTYNPTVNTADLEKVRTNIDHTYSDTLPYVIFV